MYSWHPPQIYPPAFTYEISPPCWIGPSNSEIQHAWLISREGDETSNGTYKFGMVSKTSEAPRNDDFQVRNLQLERFLFGDFTWEGCWELRRLPSSHQWWHHDHDEICGRQWFSWFSWWWWWWWAGDELGMSHGDFGKWCVISKPWEKVLLKCSNLVPKGFLGILRIAPKLRQRFKLCKIFTKTPSKWLKQNTYQSEGYLQTMVSNFV